METNIKPGKHHLTQTIIRFPEISLRVRDGHKLRGYFGNLFKDHSPLLHNHFEDGSPVYQYPLVQYKVIDNIPHLVGFQEGSQLLIDLFLKIRELDIEGRIYPVFSKNIENRSIIFDNFDTLKPYRFKTLWLGLNQKNFQTYRNLHNEEDKKKFLNRMLRNNILSFYKGIGFWTENKILVTADLLPKTAKFKGNKLLGFTGKFVTNAPLPELAGIGKSVARGFGTVVTNQRL